MPLVDLHLHCCHSDGTRTPRQVALALAEAGIGIAAIADHESFSAWDEFSQACGPLGIRPVRGMELTCIWEGLVLHILAYGFTPGGSLAQLAALNRSLLLEMSRDLMVKMSADYPQLSLAEYDAWDYEPTLGGWKGLHYLVNKGVIQAPEEGMRFYGVYDCPYSSYPFPQAGEVCAAIRQAGGIPVLAHPGNWFLNSPIEELRRTLDALLALGIGGVECYYPSHTPVLTQTCLDFCRKNKLLITAGSDCHGQFNQEVNGVRYCIGAVRVELEQLNLERLL